MSGEALAALTLEHRLAFTEMQLNRACRWLEIIAARLTYLEISDTEEKLRRVLSDFTDLTNTAVEECCSTNPNYQRRTYEKKQTNDND